MTSNTPTAFPRPGRLVRWWCRAALLPSCLLATAGAAQVVVPPVADISRQRVMPLPLPEQNFDLQILNPERAAAPRAVDEIEFSIRHIKVSGATLFSDAELAAIFVPLEGKRIVLDDLRKAGEQLEDRYRARGYFLTRVFVPPQAVRDGTLEVRVVEGFIGSVSVEALNKGSRALGSAMVGPVTAERPVRLVSLEAPLLLLNDMPGVRATGALKAGAALGSSDLILNIDRRPGQSFAVISNFASEAVGPMTYALGTSLSQPFGTPGLLDLSFSGAGQGARELQALTARYAMPLGGKGMVASIGMVMARAAPGGEVSALDIKSRSGSGSVRLRFPLVRERAHSLFLDVGLSVNRSRVAALSEPITNDRSTVADVALAWKQVGWLGGNMTVRVGLAQGLLLLGANDQNAPLPSVAGFTPKFLRLTYLLQRNQPLHGNLSAGLIVQGQYSSDTLASGEQIMFGGGLIGRGYDPSQVIGDRGIGVLGELRLGLPALSSKGWLENLQLVAFGDWAEASVNPVGNQPGSTARLASLGLGLRALAFGRIVLDAHVASARRAISATMPGGERVNVTAMVLF